MPLAALAAVVGALVLGSLHGQVAAANAQGQDLQVGGLTLGVDTMLWMSNDMTGQGPLKVPKGFPMDRSMMPGMQSPKNNRLRVEVYLRNNTTDVQRYSVHDFSVVGPDGQSWKVNIQEGSDSRASASLEPGFEVTVNMYFDIPTTKSKNLTIEWSRDGRTVSFPVHTVGPLPSKMKM